MAQSVVDVCNSALQKVGAASIMSLTDNSREARQCSIAYNSNRRAELRKRAWNFAIKRAVLAPDVAAPAFGFTYQFTLPSDCLRVLIPNDSTLDWSIEGRKLLTSLDTAVNIRYIADIEDVTQWSSSFYDTLALALAIDICEALTNSSGKKQLLMDEYREAVQESAKVNSFEKLPADPPDDSLWTVRL